MQSTVCHTSLNRHNGGSSSNTNAGGISRLSGVIFWKARRNNGNRAAVSNSNANNESSWQKENCSTAFACCDGEIQFVKTKLDFSFDQLIKTVTSKSDETALSPDDECLTCVTRRACIQSYPCGHKALCEKCFVKFLQINYSEGKYPITCVYCRSPVALFKRQDPPRSVIIKKQMDPPGSALKLLSSYPPTVPSTSIKRRAYF